MIDITSWPFKEVVPVDFPTNDVWWDLFSDTLTSMSSLLLVFLFCFAHLIGEKWYLVVLIYISYVMNEVEHLR